MTSSMPTSSATVAAARRVVAGQQDRRQTQARAARRRPRREVGLTASATTITPRASPSQPTATTVVPAPRRRLPRSEQTRRQVTAPLGEQPASGVRPPPRDRRRHPVTPTPTQVWRRPRLEGSAAELVARARRDRLRDRVLGRVLERTGQSQHLVRPVPLSAVIDVDERSCARW